MSKDDVLCGYRLQLFDLAGRIGVSAACRSFGIHRSTYYRWTTQVEPYGLEVLRPRERRRPTMPNQLSPLVEERIAAQKIDASVSHDGGSTWALRKIVSNTNSKLGWSLQAGGAVDSKGNAYFGWAGYTQNGEAKGPVNLYVSKSSDGGETWHVSRVDVSGGPPPCGCGGWAYWGAQLTVAVDGTDRAYVLYNASDEQYASNRMYFARSTDGGATRSPREDVSRAPAGANNLFPALVALGDGDLRIAWQDDGNGFDAGGDAPSARWNTYYRSSGDGGRTWSREVQLSDFVPGYDYKLADGYLEPYGDYFELDVDGAGKTHALWGEGPSYAGPGTVWYARER
jgi:hypothetical protein